MTTTKTIKSFSVKARWVRKEARIYHDSHCLYCGSNYGICKGEARACRTSTCMACGTAQCMVNGLSHGTCSVCYVGLLPGWSGNDCDCQYKGCSKPAIAYTDGVNRYRCVEHLERGKYRGYVAKQLTERDKAWVLKPTATVPEL